MNACRGEGYQIAVAVVDRFGVTQVLLRDQLAGARTPETATRKAWTAASFKTDTEAMMDETQAGKSQSGAASSHGPCCLPAGSLARRAGPRSAPRGLGGPRG